jgi:hypothetical protein
MPEQVLMARDGSVFTVQPDGEAALSLLGKFKTAEIRVRQDTVETHGPMDRFAYRRVRRSEATLTTTNFVIENDITLPCPEASATPLMSLVVPQAPWACGDDVPGDKIVTVVTDILGGGTFVGDFYFSEVGGSAGDDPSEETATLESVGPFSYTP